QRWSEDLCQILPTETSLSRAGMRANRKNRSGWEQKHGRRKECQSELSGARIVDSWSSTLMRSSQRSEVAEQNHRSERGRASSVRNANAPGRSRRSVLALGRM